MGDVVRSPRIRLIEARPSTPDELVAVGIGYARDDMQAKEVAFAGAFLRLFRAEVDARRGIRCVPTKPERCAQIIKFPSRWS